MPRVACPIPSLVVGEDAFGQVGIERSKRLQHIRPAAWMGHHRPSLTRRQATLVMKDVIDRLVDLSDVVEERDPLDAAPRPLIELSRVSEYQRVVGNAPNMGAG